MKKLNLSNNLHYLRKRRGLSQEEFAEKIHISRQAVSKWERGEAFPDTENLIEIAEFYGVTLDELVHGDEPLGAEDGESAEGGDCTPSIEAKGTGRRKRIIINEEGIEVTVDEDDDKGRKTVIIDADEINSIDDDDDGDDDNCVSIKADLCFNWKDLPYLFVVTVAYLLLGVLTPNGWSVYWPLFFTIPLYYTLIESIKKRRFVPFAYPFLCAFVYCLLGTLYGLWHPGWIIFVTIPIYYMIAEQLDRLIRSREEKRKEASDEIK